ncbi:unnamed protein product [Euphydryas editha]|uniref:Uncharacterized protein n=1 Tax=Euphydryas editha TaxID=104508 RepID=A0AAU9U5S7_EUPED|nr:unnamed protein product [Euphydryas editha]
MPQRASSSSSLMRPFVVLALPGMYLLYKYNQYRQQQMETARRRVTERELMHLNTKITQAGIRFTTLEQLVCANCSNAGPVENPKQFDDIENLIIFLLID